MARGTSILSGVALFCGLSAVGCAGPGAQVAPAVAPHAAPAATSLQSEARVMGVIATSDPRLLERTSLKPSDEEMRRAVAEAVRREHPFAVAFGRIDVFSVDARTEPLARAAALVAEDKKRAAGAGPAAQAEVRRAEQLVLEETYRAKKERVLADVAAPLLRDEFRLWVAATGAEGDPILARRFGDVEDALDDKTLDVLDGMAIDDVLGPFERRLERAGNHGGFEALTSLRLALGALQSRPAKGSRVARYAEEVRVFSAGAGYDPASFGAARSLLRSWSQELSRELAADKRSTLEQEAADAFLDPAACRPAGLVTAPPEERTFGCGLFQRIAREGVTPTALLALHDVVTAAMWAQALLEDRSRYIKIVDDLSLWSHVPYDDRTRLMRAVAAEPVRFLLAGANVAWVVGAGREGTRARATELVEAGFPPLGALDQSRAQRPPAAK